MSSAQAPHLRNAVAEWLAEETGLSIRAAIQIAEYFGAVHRALGVIPSQDTLVIERFFDESGGMQLVLHSPWGSRINRAWGLALRKRFCRKFNFELQAAATDDAIVLSLGTQHSFPLEEVFHYLHSNTVRDVLVQALLDAPMFTVRWRWNAARSLAIPRQRGSRRTPPPLQRMEAEDLIAAVFPDQLACLENIVGDREIPDHPLVNQTIHDCLTEAMDIDGLVALLQRIESGSIRCVAKDLPEPSPLAHEILNAKPYAFLDNAPLEERRTQAVYTRRALDSASNAALGILDAAAIHRVCEEAWPAPANEDEMHDALMQFGLLADNDLSANVEIQSDRPSSSSKHLPRIKDEDECDDEDDRSNSVFAHALNQGSGEIGPTTGPPGQGWPRLLRSLAQSGRATRMCVGPSFWVAVERLSMVSAVYPNAVVDPPVAAPGAEQRRSLERADALRELLRGRLELSGPVTAAELSRLLEISSSEIETALLALEAEGFILRGRFRPDAPEQEWCERRLLARIHRLTINRLRAEIQPVPIAEFCRFLAAWQRVDPEHQVEGPEGVEALLELLDGYELAAGVWEPDVLCARAKDYDPQWLDRVCFTGRVGWGRLSVPGNASARSFSMGPLRSSPISIFAREHLRSWLALCAQVGQLEFAPDTRKVLEILSQGGALFFAEIVRGTGLLPSQAERALGELSALGLVTADSFDGLRALLIPAHKKPSLANTPTARRRKTVTSVEFAGRWSLLRQAHGQSQISNSKSQIEAESDPIQREKAIELFARTLLRRYGVVFRRLLERESIQVPWYELGRVFRRLEARGEIRGGHFVAGVSGEQFALPEAINQLRSIRKESVPGRLIALSAADPLNLAGILTPGRRIPAVAANRILLRDGVIIAALAGEEVLVLDQSGIETDQVIEHALRVGKLPASLRRYYG
ncbi:MAG: DEAD/DEAH box helicase [Verrucomicrobia bacterium]|nr:DEAD/DEAH box helicase [Verrucomicrobiota bacterium]